jgi:hypothetical protein
MFAGFFAAASAGLGSPIPTAIAGDSQVKISWAPPTQPIFKIDVEESLDSGNIWITAVKLPPTSTHVNLQNLTNGKNYWFRVRWIWLDGSLGIPSPTLVAIPINNPNAPTGLVATASADQVGLSWDQDPNKSIVGYEIDLSTHGENNWTVIKANTGSPSNGYLVNNLLAGTTYTFRIRAIGFAGVLSEYSETAVAKIAAAAPIGGYALNYTIKNSKVTLIWDTPADLSDVQTYQVNISGDGGVNWFTVATTQGGINTAVVPYVIGGSTYQVIATSAAGLTSSSQIQLVQTNLIPDSAVTSTSSPVAVSNPTTSPTPNSSSIPITQSTIAQGSSVQFIVGAILVIGIGAGVLLFTRSRKNNNSRRRYSNKVNRVKTHQVSSTKKGKKKNKKK